MLASPAFALSNASVKQGEGTTTSRKTRNAVMASGCDWFEAAACPVLRDTHLSRGDIRRKISTYLNNGRITQTVSRVPRVAVDCSGIVGRFICGPIMCLPFD